jgi:hypothetical protein
MGAVDLDGAAGESLPLPNTANDSLDAALWYLEQGFSLIPIPRGTKVPSITGWKKFQTERPTQQQVIEWFSNQWRGHNIALIMGAVSGRWALDIDDGAGKNGSAQLADLEAQYEPLPLTWTQRTGGGGRHMLFAYPSNQAIKNSAGKLGAHLDTRGDGGYIIVAPSKHASGVLYEWELGKSPDDLPIAEAPGWLLNLLAGGGQSDLVPLPASPAQAVSSAIPERLTPMNDYAGNGKLEDGREAYAFNLLTAHLVDFIKNNGACPTEQELFDSAWPTYSAKVDLTRSGRDQDFFFNKCQTRIAAFNDGQIPGAESLEAVVGFLQQPHPDSPALLGTAVGALHVLSVADARNQPISGEYFIKDLVAPWQSSVWFGAPGSGKSFLALDVFYRASLKSDDPDRRIFGRRVRPTRTIYCALEAGAGLARRVNALEAKYGESTDFYYIPMDIPFNDPKLVRNLIDAAIDFDAGIICIDTLSVALNGEDENSPQGMGMFLRQLRLIVASTGAHVAVIHHSGKDQDRGERGHSSLTGAVDVRVGIVGQVNPRVATILKNKEAEAGQIFGFNIDPVQLGTDIDGDEITTCTVSETAVKKTGAGQTANKPTAAQRLLISDTMALFADSATTKVKMIPEPGMAAQETINRDQLKVHFGKRGRIELNDDFDFAADKDRRQFGKLIDRLRELGTIGVSDEKIWLTCSFFAFLD